MNKQTPIKLDVNQILKERLSKYYKFIPKRAIDWLKRTICQDRLNELMEANNGKNGPDFCRGVLDCLNVTYSIENSELLPDISDRRVIFICNHPLGALDGIAIIDMIASKYGNNLKFVVNDLLNAIKPLNNIFLPINKHGRQKRSATTAIDAAFSSDIPIIMFPAGLVSRMDSDGTIRDLQWHKMFVNKAIQSERDIIPLFFTGNNSSFFYKFARCRVRLGLKFNIEMIYLPQEVFRCKNSHFNIIVGKRIPWKRLQGGSGASQTAEAIKQIVYGLCNNKVVN